MLLVIRNCVGNLNFFYLHTHTQVYRNGGGPAFVQSLVANIGDRLIFVTVHSPGANRDMYARCAMVPAADTTTS